MSQPPERRDAAFRGGRRIAHLAIRLLWGGGLAYKVLLVGMLVLLAYSAYEWRRVARTKVERSAAIGGEKLNPGPWGDVTCVPITISPPLEFVAETRPAGKTPVAWRFPRMNRNAMARFLTQFSLSEGLRQSLLADAQSDAATGGQVVFPGRERVLGLSPDDRAGLYFALGQFGENLDQQRAFRSCGASTEAWFHNVRLSAHTLRLIRPLVYRLGRIMLFADLRTVEPDLASETERRLLIKALSQQRTFLLRLNVTADTNIEALVQYWGRRGQAKDIRPILESLARINRDEEGEDIGISHLLPPFARSRIFTYPLPLDSALAVSRDCHWTALNFLAETPDDAYCDMAAVAKAIASEYHRVYRDFRVGDMALFFNGPNTYIHSAVYIADDIYFTKNGPAATHPWMFMSLQDLEDFYLTLTPLRVEHYRRNGY